MLEIISNGSKWYGEKPDTIEDLIQVLNTEILDPSFEDYGNFINLNPTWLKKDFAEKYKGCVKIFGNFMTVSHVFNIITDQSEIIQKLTEAINKNKGTEEYKRFSQQRQRIKQRELELKKQFNSGKFDLKTYHNKIMEVKADEMSSVSL